MRNRIVTRVLAAVFAGAMLMTTPSVAMAYTAEHTEQVDMSVPAAVGLAVVYQEGITYITWNNVCSWTDERRQYMTVEWSEDPQFPNDERTSNVGTSGSALSLNNAIPGKTYYIRAFITETVYQYDEEGNYDTVVTKHGPYSETIEYTPKVPDVHIAESSVTSSTVSFRFGRNDAYYGESYLHYMSAYAYTVDQNGDGKVDADDNREYFGTADASYESSAYEQVTGFEIYRATATGSYKKVATVADTSYTDKNLKSSTSYRYKIRAYVLDPASGEKIYGDYKYVRKTTWGSDPELKATAAGTKTVKLSWKKVTGASGYKIYRYIGDANSLTEKNGQTAGFSNYKLIKTITKASTVSYKDTKLAAGETYSYKIVAYKNVNGSRKPMNIESSDSITLGFRNSFGFTNTVKAADGSITATWKKVIGAEGYAVQKKDSRIGAWTTVAVLDTNTTSYTFAAAAEEKTAEFRVYAYAGNNISDYKYVTAEYVQTVGRTSGITATAKADLTGVTVSWAEVPGAAYYEVYRSRQLGRYNADRGFYNIPGGVVVQTVKKDGKLAEGVTYYEWDQKPDYTSAITGTSVEDVYQGYQYRTEKWDEAAQKYVETIETEEIQKAPAMGVRYYYYVQAFAADGTPVAEDITRDMWDETTGEYVQQKIGTHTVTYYRGGLSGKPASVVLNSVSLKRPTISKVTAGKAKATVSWKKVTGASRYYVYYSTKKNSGYTFAGITTKTKLSVTGLTSGKKYYFKVKACTANAAGADVFSSLSAAKSKTVK